MASGDARGRKGTVAETILKSAELETFFENVALMLSVGIQTDEAVHMLAENSEERKLEKTCLHVYDHLIHGKKLSQAMEGAGAFPVYAIDMVKAGERTGHLEDTLKALANYYDEEDRLFLKIRSSVTYPAIILCVMSVVLGFTVAAILPVFLDVYQNMAGGLAASSFSMVDVGIGIGWVALAITVLCTLMVLVAFVRSHSAKGRLKLLHSFERFPGTKKPFFELAQARFTSTLAVYTASGVNSDDAMAASLNTIEHDKLRKRVKAAYQAMIEPIRARSLIQAVGDFQVYDPMHVRMLTFGMRSGQLDDALMSLSDELFDDAIGGFDALIDRIEPALAAFVTIAVALTLIAVMLPLIGIMGSIG